ncbi:uncharacterized protein LACBIDRAFT_333093 [Laccaria bicolor S238N-H82]|uniref:Predicted protein n=1 Tax=Laccaria bicolor (strain S238N-H82 / ATCC MYA-4686) TaxID=486041 RepID=B0DUU6_LACBS|nr:uncharacterized protein LACBIDRAFT_333093 [Laccaria bicolor S238N-H82]EDR01673.1 predicted protein [Laccaria bicolor S238N-H82]|eukprot:XP_001887749.1 predicted protein [Laccaria bicolor S238N-H82]
MSKNAVSLVFIFQLKVLKFFTCVFIDQIPEASFTIVEAVFSSQLIFMPEGGEFSLLGELYPVTQALDLRSNKLNIVNQVVLEGLYWGRLLLERLTLNGGARLETNRTALAQTSVLQLLPRNKLEHLRTPQKPGFSKYFGGT